MNTATLAQHPSRSAPQCRHCKHLFTSPIGVPMCDHPTMPVDTATGWAAMSCEAMRSPLIAHHLNNEEAALYQQTDIFCRAEGKLFEPRIDPAESSSTRAPYQRLGATDLVGGECPAPAVLAQAQGAHQLGADAIVGAKEDAQAVVFHGFENLIEAYTSNARRKNLNKMGANSLVLLGFVVQRSSVDDLLPKLTDALSTVARLDDGSDEVLAVGKGVHHEHGCNADPGQGAGDPHARSPQSRVDWLFTDGSVPFSALPGEVGTLPLSLLASPRIGAWINHAVCIRLEPEAKP